MFHLLFISIGVNRASVSKDFEHTSYFELLVVLTIFISKRESQIVSGGFLLALDLMSVAVLLS